MNKVNKKLIVTLLIILVAVFAGWKFSGSFSNNNAQTPAPVNPTIAEVDVTKKGFNPVSIKISSGTEVIWRVKDNSVHRIVSNPHPEHTDLPELDSKTNISKNDTYAYTFNKVGVFHYHDENNPELNGTINVE